MSGRQVDAQTNDVGGVKRVATADHGTLELAEAKRQCQDSLSAEWKYIRVDYPYTTTTDLGNVCGVALKMAKEESTIYIAFDSFVNYRSLRQNAFPLVEIFLPTQMSVSSVSLMR
ncbi:hypothetical protein H2200_013012 [Cladophialophora chaetospira]|uniref:Uncharacterized protein n=1 Tax=Cladophialophora chaetospira TaxID=386627 RepID=A0AA38WWL0_9EURO|nr:hypothetical protein H2200_013012 [Cladophialophora chaetospira]